MKRYIIILVIIITSSALAMGQGSVDALRYSRIDIGGTARYMGMGGAFGALGADFTSASTNPAGIGLYRSSEFSITPSVFIGKTESSYNGELGMNQRTSFNLGNLGFVLTSKLDSRKNPSAWKYVHFAMGINRLANFNNRIEITGFNPENSLLDIYVQEANGINYWDIEDDPNGYYGFDLHPAWWTFLLDLQDTSIYNQYISPIPNGNIQQSKSIDTKGSMNEYVFNVAGNFSDKLYIGATFGIPFIRYYEYSVYKESDNDDLLYDFDSFNRIETLETRGNGFNFKIGMLYRLNDKFRFGAAFHSPSWFNNMRDYWQVTMRSYFDQGDTYVKSSPSGNYTYRLSTPWRLQGNLGFVIGNIGLISADYEYVDYSSARLSAYDYSFNSENQSINNSYVGAHHIRLGTEWRYNIFSFRAGANYFTSPYKSGINDAKRIGLSGGVGMRQNWFFLDLAYTYTGREEDYYLYNTSDIFTNATRNNIKTHTILMTLGVKF
jgi:hypothetical protein